MNPYALTLFFLAAALLAQAIASGLACEMMLRRDLSAGERRPWAGLAIGALLLGLHHGYTLELALRTGLYDLRQAVLAGLAALLTTLAVRGFRRRAG